MDNLGLAQPVTEPIHCKGHMLDLIMSEGFCSETSSVQIVVTDIGLSDHFCVLFKMSITIDL